MSYFTGKQYERAGELLTDYLQVGGSIEDVYRTLGLLSECAYHLGKFDLALEYATKCATLKPEYPMAYWLLAQYEADQNNYEEALEWVKVSETKPDPQTLSVWDPSSRGRATLIAARCLFMLGRYNEALAQIRKIEHLAEVQDVLPDFYEQADAETFVTLLPKLRKFFHNDESLYEALCDAMRYDERLRPLRNIATTPKIWSDKSIVIFCGQGYEEWGPHTLDKGMGGSEEAVIYLSRELSKLGYEVTVYGEVPHRVWDTTEEPKDYNVHYLPWKQIDMRDQFNVFVSWRAPQYIEKVNAKVKLVDVHDVLWCPPRYEYVELITHINLFPRQVVNVVVFWFFGGIPNSVRYFTVYSYFIAKFR
jgi:tetratricopeptide (TPR) repeat protein